jgi:hypothetical protein
MQHLCQGLESGFKSWVPSSNLRQEGCHEIGYEESMWQTAVNSLHIRASLRLTSMILSSIVKTVELSAKTLHDLTHQSPDLNLFVSSCACMCVCVCVCVCVSR